MITDAPAIGNPDSSVTLPVIVPLKRCPESIPAAAIIKTMNKNVFLIISNAINKQHKMRRCSDKLEMITLFPYAGIIRIRF